MFVIRALFQFEAIVSQVDCVFLDSRKKNRRTYVFARICNLLNVNLIPSESGYECEKPFTRFAIYFELHLAFHDTLN